MIDRAIASAAIKDTAPVRRLCAWLLERDAPMAPEERRILVVAERAILLWEDSWSEDDTPGVP